MATFETTSMAMARSAAGDEARARAEVPRASTQRLNFAEAETDKWIAKACLALKGRKELIELARQVDKGRDEGNGSRLLSA